MAVHNQIIENRTTNRLNLFRQEEEERKHSSRLLGRLSPNSGISFTPASGRDDYLPKNQVESLVQGAMSSGYRINSLSGPYAAPKPPRQLDEQPSLGVDQLIGKYVSRLKGYG